MVQSSDGSSTGSSGDESENELTVWLDPIPFPDRKEKHMLDWLDGKKTYIVAIVAGALAAAKVLYPAFAVPEWVWIALGAFGLGFLRAGVEKK